MTAWIGRLAFEQKDPAVDNPKHPQPDRLFQRVAVVQNQGAVEKQYIAVFKINELPEVVRLDVANIHQSDPGAVSYTHLLHIRPDSLCCGFDEYNII